MSKHGAAARAGKHHSRNDLVATRAPLLGYFLIVTDGKETEINYFQELRKSIPRELQRRLVIKTVYADGAKELLDQTRKAILSCGGQEVTPWIVFDRDEVPEFDALIHEAEERGIHVGWSNPCFEIWLWAYFGRMKTYASSQECYRAFYRMLESVCGHPCTKHDKDIFRIVSTKGSVQTAFIAARSRHASLGKRLPSECNSCTTVYELVETIYNRIAGLRITSQPADLTVVAGSEATYRIQAIGHDLNYRWQHSWSPEGGWQDFERGHQPDLSFSTGREYCNGWNIRCIVTDAEGHQEISRIATLTCSTE